MRWIVACLALVNVAVPAGAWNDAGHRAIAAMAYARLTPQARARVDVLIARHPDYESIFLNGAPTDPTERAKYAFSVAATWPDLIRGDPRFWDDGNPNAAPKPTLPGFPDMRQHRNWHYVDLPFSPDGTALKDAPVPNALTALEQLLAGIAKPLDDPAEPTSLLPWILHLVGDLHQPLHCVSRFLHSDPDGDAGGNRAWITPPPSRLHAYWDGLPAPSEVGTADPDDVVDKTPREWAEEGLAIARESVYSFGNAEGSREQPVSLPPGYRERAEKIARERMTLAGERLAAVLNQRLK